MSGTGDAGGTAVPSEAELPVRATGGVSMRDIGAGEPDWSSDALSDLARARGIDREFAFRELITSQAYDSQAAWGADWKNWLDDIEATNVGRYRPSDADELRQVLLPAVDDSDGDRQTVRAVGAGHSHSRAAAPDEAFVELSWYDDDPDGPGQRPFGLIDTLDADWQRSNKENVLHFDPGEHEAPRLAAGNPLKYLNRVVLKDDDQALLNMGSYDAQTLAGAVNTGTHGTGTEFGTLADAVLSVELLTVTESPVDEDVPLVRKYRIEPEPKQPGDESEDPSVPITDREAFEDDVGDHGMTLIQDDTIFYSAVVGYGGMGIATAYTFKVANEKFYLKEHTDVREWSDLKKNIRDDYLDDEDVRQMQFLLNLQAVQDGTAPKTMCLVRYYTEEDWPQNASPNERDGQGPFRWLRQFVTKGGVDPLSSNPFLAAILNQIYFRRQTKPQFNGDSTTASYVALRRTRDENHSNPAGPPSAPTLGMSTEIAVPVEEVTNAVDEVISTVKSGVKVDGNRVRFAGPMGVRFVDSGKHKFTPEFEDPDRPDGVAMVEVPFSVEPVRAVAHLASGAAWLLMSVGPMGWGALTVIANQLLPSHDISQERMLEISKQALVHFEHTLSPSESGYNLIGRPHMGKLNHVGKWDEVDATGIRSSDGTEIGDLYPLNEFRKWHGVYKQFNAFGTFNNSFLEGLDLNVKRDDQGAHTDWGRSDR